MSAALKTLIEQVEQLLGDETRHDVLSVPSEWTGSLSTFESEWRDLIQAVRKMETRLVELESGRRLLLERIVEALKELT